MAIKLYNLLPIYLRERDYLASGTSTTEEGGNLAKVLSCFDEELELTQDEIEGLLNLVDVQSCPTAYLAYLSSGLGTSVGQDTTKPSGFRRWLIANLVWLYKIKGTHPCIEKVFEWKKNVRYKLYELWKTIPHEYDQYSRQNTYDHNIRAARYDIYTESGGIQNFLTPGQAESLVPFIEDLTPIHVILRRYVLMSIFQDNLGDVNESLADTKISVSRSENVTPVLSDIDSDQNLSCQATCEVYCQSEYELATCSSGCQATCEAGCETGCQHACEDSCQHHCQFLCQATCESTCETGACESTCEIACMAGGCEETPCALSVQGAGTYGACQSSEQGCPEPRLYPTKLNSINHYQGFWYGPVYWPFSPDDASGACWFSCETGCEWTACETTQELWRVDVAGRSIHEVSDGCPPSMSAPKRWTKMQAAFLPKRDKRQEELTGVGGANGTQTTWSGNLANQPHPCTIKFLAEGVPAATGRCTITGDELYNPKVKHNTVGIQAGYHVKLMFKKGNLSAQEWLTVSSVLTENKLRLSSVPTNGAGIWSYEVYPTAGNGEWRQIVFTQMVEPSGIGLAWNQSLDGDGTGYVNVRSPYDYSVTFAQAPPKGAKVIAEYTGERSPFSKYRIVQPPSHRVVRARIQVVDFPSNGMFTCKLLDDSGSEVGENVYVNTKRYPATYLGSTTAASWCFPRMLPGDDISVYCHGGQLWCTTVFQGILSAPPNNPCV